MSSSASLTSMITIDSADRNQIAYPDPAQYVYKLPESIRNADTIELMMFQMTLGEGSVSSANSSFTLVKETTNITVTIPEGVYTYGVTDNNEKDICAALTTALNNVSDGFYVTSNVSSTFDNAYEVSDKFFNNGVGPLIIQHTDEFKLVINSETARLLGLFALLDSSGNTSNIGFERGAGMIKSTVVGGSNTIIGTKSPDMNGTPYVMLGINDYHPNVSLSSVMYNNFITIPLENKQIGNRFTISNDLKEKKGVYKLGPTQSKVDQLAITILRPDGSLYNFSGFDHQIVLRIMRKDGQNFTV
jgi:hypothetical protein